MKNSKRITWLAISLLMSMLTVSVSYAQNTASAIGGTVIDSDGNAVSGVTVVVKHIPTGTTKTISTNENGNYQFRGLRVGGPYSVSMSKDGFGDVNRDDLYIKLGDVKDVDATLVADSVSLDSIDVVGIIPSSDVFNPDNMGTGSVVTREQIDDFASTDRSLADFARLDSRVRTGTNGRTGESDGSFSAAGVNNRYNNISIDGVSTNDEFGLEPTGQPGLSQAFSLDTIKELQVQLSPFDTALGNFVGLNVNAVTKSGTNELEGRVNLFYQDESFARDGLTDFSNETYNISLGGPIIKDKLFFFINYENKDRTELGDEVNGGNIENNADGTPNANVLEAARIAREVWGFDPGNLASSLETTDTQEKILLKLDWNINDSQRLSFKYNQNQDSDFNLRHFGGGDISFDSHWFVNEFKNTNYSAILYSDWTPNFSTEARVVLNEFDKAPRTFSDLPQIRIRLGRDDIYMGTEQFRHSNLLAVDTTTAFFAGEYFKGLHTFKFGVDYKGKDTNNLFIRNSKGVYEFRSLEDFAAGDYSRYEYQYSNDPNNPEPSADWSIGQVGLFAQDTLIVNDRLTVMYGFRYDRPSIDKKPELNQLFLDTFGVPNNDVLDTGIFQPRVGFNFDMSDELDMQLRGGIGLFAGSTPDVWLSNSYTNTGIATSQIRDFNDGATFNPDPNNQPIIPGSSKAEVNLMDPDFEYPSSWKANLALDAELPWYGIIAHAEMTYAKVVNEVFYENINLGPSIGTLPDGRVAYDARHQANENFLDVLRLTNTSKGETKTFTLGLETPIGEHFKATAFYTFTDAQDVSSATSSQARSNWRFRPIANQNTQELATSNFEIENSFVGTLNYSNNFFGDTYTKMSLIYISHDGNPFSYVYDGDANGDGQFSNDLVYVPNADEYVMADPTLRNDFENYLAASGLDAYRGQITPRNAFKAPRQNRWDLRIQQELPQLGRARATIFFDVQNLGNLLNDSWGQVNYVRFGNTQDFGSYEVNDNGQYVINWDGDTDPTTKANFASRWSAQIGFRINF